MYRHMCKYITKMYTIPLHVHTCIHNKDVHNTIMCTDTCEYITKMYTIPSCAQTHVYTKQDVHNTITCTDTWVNT